VLTPGGPVKSHATLPDFLHPFHEALLVQCYPHEVLALEGLVRRAKAGLVITAEKGNRRFADALLSVYQSASHLRECRDFPARLLLDANRYSGATRLTAQATFDQRWINRQRELNLPVLTDSGYVAEGDERGLCSILSRAAALGDAIALLPLHLSWLRSKTASDTLVGRVEEARVPVALVLEHENDPLGLVGVVPSLLRLLRSNAPVMPLRSDVSAIGALCMGAVCGAVGSSTALRHLYPQKDGGGRVEAQVAAVVKECLSFVRLEKVTIAAQTDPDDVLWQCDCDVCQRHPLPELALLPRPRQETLASRHSFEVLLDLRDELLNSPTDAARRESWRARCQAAQFRHFDVESVTDKWEPPRFLGRWLKALEPTSLHQERVR